MEAHKAFTRTQSSLLRSSATVRSSIQSLTSIAENSETEKTQNKTGPTRFTLGVSLTFLTLFSFSFFFIFFRLTRKQDIPTSENLLFFLLFIAMTLFFINKNKKFIKRLNIYVPETKPKQVQWFIGEEDQEEDKDRKNKVIREGVEFYSNGDYYEGEFNKGLCNGSGVYNFFVNGRYEGEWVEGRYDGYGIESWAKGSKYRGEYKGGFRHGVGVYRFYTGDSYAGEWFNGQSHRVGVQSCCDGSCFFGEFKFGVKHGLGVYHFRNGDRYAGEYFGDKIHGFGVYHFANGHCYEGSWHEGQKQGYGMYTFRSCDPKGGEWDGGTLKIHLPPQNDAVLRAVEAARRAAENAVHLRRVDEQVCQAVQAANRAANAARVAAVKAVQNRIDRRFCEMNL